MTDEPLAAATATSSSRDLHLFALLLSLCAGIAFVVGGLLGSCSNRLSDSRQSSNLAPFALMLAFSTAAFVFISGGIADLLPLAQSRFEQLVLIDNANDSVSEEAARGVSHLLATTSFAAGAMLLYGVNVVVLKLTASASACFESCSVQQGREPSSATLRHHIGLNIAAGTPTTRDSAGSGEFGPNSSIVAHFEVLQSTDRPRGAQLSTKCATSALFNESPTTVHTKAHIRASAISILAIVLHHMPAGSVIYISAMNHFQLGEVLAFAVVLHSLPDGKAFASSIYFASGSQRRGVLWSLLAPVGKALGSLVAWILLRDDSSAFSHCFLSGMAAGALVASGVAQILPTACVCAVGRSHGLVLGAVLGVALLTLPKVFLGVV